MKLLDRYSLSLLTFISLLLAACQPMAPPVPQTPYDFSISINPAQQGLPANRMLLGNNVQWVDRGDELLTGDGKSFDEQKLQAVRALGPSILRYPGGSLADTYRWKAGMGDQSARGESEHFYSRKIQTIRMGTREFLELCEATGAQALITVNVASGTPEEAADWVRQINITGLNSSRTGKRFPRVAYWEIGNEPYLHDENQKKLWMTPEVFAQRANAFIRAMRAVDPSIEVGIPLRSDSIGGVPATPLQGFNRAVLKGISERIQFVALHNAYMPLALGKKYDDTQLFTAATAAAETVKADLDATRAMLKQWRPNDTIRLAITEYNALFSLGQGRSDEYISTQVGAIYVADLLSMLAQTPDVWSAQYWSLSGNWKFGTIANNGALRPGYHVLQAYSALLYGKLVEARVETEQFSVPQTGFAIAVNQRQRVGSLATVDGNTLRVLVFNRDLYRPGRGSLQLSAAQLAGPATLRLFTADNPFDPNDRKDKLRISESTLTGPNVSFALPPLAWRFSPCSSRKAASKCPKSMNCKTLRRAALPWEAGLRVLEAGCGSTSHISLPENARITGIDISERQLARNSSLSEAILGDLQAHRWPADSFDLILCWDVLEHLPQPQEAIARMVEGLRPGGLIVLALPNLLSLKGLVTRFTPYWFHVAFYRYVIGDKRPAAQWISSPPSSSWPVRPRAFASRRQRLVFACCIPALRRTGASAHAPTSCAGQCGLLAAWRRLSPAHTRRHQSQSFGQHDRSAAADELKRGSWA